MPLIAALLLVLIVVAWLASRQTSTYAERKFAEELSAIHAEDPRAAQLVTEDDIALLPEAVRRYFRFMNVVGKPRDWSLQARFGARFRLADGQWLPCEARQYDTRLGVARIFHMQLTMKHVLPVLVRDTYQQGQGLMAARVFDLFPVATGSGHEIDVGELVTYLNDAVLMAPSFLLGPETTWSAVEGNPNAFDVALRDHEHSVRARVFIDENGAPTNFSTTDRFFDAPDGKRIRTEWTTPIDGWQTADGRRLPTRGQAVWMLPTGPFSYADFQFDPKRIAHNMPSTR